MPILLGVYAAAADASRSEHWTVLTAGLAPPIAEIHDGPLHVGIFAQHAGERALTPGDRAPLEGGRVNDPIAIGFGGDGLAETHELCPPWLRCEYSAASRTLRLITDRYGFVLLFVRSVDGCTVFGTSALHLARVKPALSADISAVIDLLAFEHVLGDKTQRVGIQLLPGGVDLVIAPTGVSTPHVFKYGDIPLRSRRPAAGEWVAEWQRAVATSVSCTNGQPIILPLSGGLDSRLIAAGLASLESAVDAFTFASHAHGARPPADAVIAERVARTLGFPWRLLPLEDDWIARHARRAIVLTDGLYDVMHSAGISVTEHFTPGGVRVDGLFGDVVLGGKFLGKGIVQAHSREARLRALWQSRSRLESAAWSSLVQRSERAELAARARASLAASLDEVLHELPSRDPRWFDVWMLRQRARRFTLNGSLLWLACCRSVFPFFAPRFFDAIFGSPPELRSRGELQPMLYEHGWPELAAIPWQKTGRPVRAPTLRATVRELLQKPAFPPNQPFFDPDAEFRRSQYMQTFFTDLILDPSVGIARFGFFDRDAVERLLRDMRTGKRRGMYQIGLLGSLVLAELAWSKA